MQALRRTVAVLTGTSIAHGGRARARVWRFLAVAVIGLSAGVLLPAASAEAAPLCIREASPSTVTYELRYGVAGDTIVIGGFRTSTVSHTVPLSGSAYVNSQGAIVIGFTVHFDYGSGVWATTASEVVIRISGGVVTYDVSFVPAGSTTPVNRTGTGSIVACSAIVTSTSINDALSSGADPAVRGPATTPPVTRQGSGGPVDPEAR